MEQAARSQASAKVAAKSRELDMMGMEQNDCWQQSLKKGSGRSRRTKLQALYQGWRRSI